MDIKWNNSNSMWERIKVEKKNRAMKKILKIIYESKLINLWMSSLKKEEYKRNHKFECYRNVINWTQNRNRLIIFHNKIVLLDGYRNRLLWTSKNFT